MSAFTADWLRLRAPFDEAARSIDLARRYAAALPRRAGEPQRIVDLAAGSGQNFMALAPAIDGEQDWVLVDHDPALLAAQFPGIGRWSRERGWRSARDGSGMVVEKGSARWRVRSQRIDLAQFVEQVDFAGCDGVTTSAFLDLVSAAWLDRLSTLLARHARLFLAALTVDGRLEWRPSLPADARVRAAFEHHQARDKGFGPALGGRAASHLAGALRARGYTVMTARSDWRIGAGHRAMLREMVAGTAAAASEAEPAASAAFAEWAEARRNQITAGALTLEIGHVDVLAVPPGT